MRVGVTDIGTNSTRLYIADVDDHGRIDELVRRSEITRLGDKVDSTGRLSDAAIARVFSTLNDYTALMDEQDATERPAVLTSAVRDADNGAEFVDTIRERFGLDAQMIEGAREAQLSFLGATSDRDASNVTPTLVIDVGGGSTELIVGASREVGFSVSLQAGAVRYSERHLHSDPPTQPEFAALASDLRATIEAGVPAEVRRSARAAIAVAGTATSCAAVDQALDPYDPKRVHGYRLELTTLKLLLARLAAMPLAERRNVRGLHPDRAPTIVAGISILIGVLQAFELDSFEASEHDILRGVALDRAGFA
ncbi:MAG TPA: Ppx/GppA family phosphatase [Solirubrobacteraceae bacterium]|jgi:exopolyphosphatase/guanosine-5'-triphosphate,3'-diphosphate pyrophosphatase|nr:Ppx/GppA family phosphatase [Solirubrobacteraceae bacterium]